MIVSPWLSKACPSPRSGIGDANGTGARGITRITVEGGVLVPGELMELLGGGGGGLWHMGYVRGTGAVRGMGAVGATPTGVL